MMPDENFFRYVLSQEKIMPEECLFIDDGPRNCCAASELGLFTYCPQNGEDWCDKITSLIFQTFVQADIFLFLF